MLGLHCFVLCGQLAHTLCAFTHTDTHSCTKIFFKLKKALKKRITVSFNWNIIWPLNTTAGQMYWTSKVVTGVNKGIREVVVRHSVIYCHPNMCEADKERSQGQSSQARHQVQSKLGLSSEALPQTILKKNTHINKIEVDACLIHSNYVTWIFEQVIMCPDGPLRVVDAINLTNTILDKLVFCEVEVKSWNEAPVIGEIPWYWGQVQMLFWDREGNCSSPVKQVPKVQHLSSLSIWQFF